MIALKGRERFFFHVHRISDATGETLLSVARAATAQYTASRAIEHAHTTARSARREAAGT